MKKVNVCKLKRILRKYVDLILCAMWILISCLFFAFLCSLCCNWGPDFFNEVTQFFESEFSSQYNAFFFISFSIFVVWLIAFVHLVSFSITLIRDRKKNSGKDLQFCPMLECLDDGCVYFDKECNICKFADNSELLNDEVTDDV